MAEVCKATNDFLLFPQRLSSLGTFDSRPDRDDFGVLLPNRFSANDMDNHQDFAGHVNTSYDAYPSVSAYSSGFFGAPDDPYDAQKKIIGHALRRDPSSGSPSPSNPQAFDHPSSTLSSASGASAQSTASSADGSPYVNASHNLPYPEKWPEPLHGLGLAPEIVDGKSFHNDQFPTSQFENDLALEGNKFPDYVGEYRAKFSSSPLASSSVASSFLPASSAAHGVRSIIPYTRKTLDPAKDPLEITIDSIIEEAKGMVQSTAQPSSPDLTTPNSGSPTLAQTSRHQPSHSDSKSSFRCSTVPTSTAPPLSSPVVSPSARGDRTPQHKIVNLPDDVETRSKSHQPLHHFRPHYSAVSAFPNNGSAPSEKSQNLFFGHSSGRFIAPLESSCSFSLPSPLAYS